VIYTKKRKILPLVQRKERESKGIYKRADKKGIYLAIKVIPDCAYIFCREKRQEEENNTRLLVFQ